ncbi:MAG TPA: hypothetical protein VJP85_04210 [Candidatus Baltobacteraceae bacterium]|nr:hypothetical protein [Candidatus Baltobacteraceae bacterium]
MTELAPAAMIATALLLGAFVTAGGAYGIAFTLGKSLNDARWLRFAPYAYAFQCALAAAVLLFTPLDWWWKTLVAASALAYYFVPPLTWRYFLHLHDSPEKGAS